jgi:hypothetical protein
VFIFCSITPMIIYRQELSLQLKHHQLLWM